VVAAEAEAEAEAADDEEVAAAALGVGRMRAAEEEAATRDCSVLSTSDEDVAVAEDPEGRV